jgi:hypothetical protein
VICNISYSGNCDPGEHTVKPSVVIAKPANEQDEPSAAPSLAARIPARNTAAGPTMSMVLRDAYC